MENLAKLITEYQNKAVLSLKTIENINTELKKVGRDSADAEWFYAERKVENAKYMAYIQFVHDLENLI